MTPARRTSLAAAAALLLLSAFPFIGRSVISSDGAEVLGEAASALAQGRFAYGRIPPERPSDDAGGPPLHSKYGLFPSFVPLLFLAPAWPFRLALGAPLLDAAVALTWWAGACAAALAFLALVRALAPRASPFWAPAFLAGTFLWPYAADSFVEPFAAAALAASAALVLRSPDRPVPAAALWASACLLKPLLWVTAPVAILAIALDRAAAARRVPRATGVFLAAAVLQALVNHARTGSFLDVGYGTEVLRFSTPFLHGLWGLAVSPGRGLVLYAPVCLVALLAVRRLEAPALALCVVAPAVLLVVAARWWSWEGGSCWGPRHLLPVLPLLAAPAVLARAALARAALAVGALVNLGGVVIAPGSWIGYAEGLSAPRDASWPAAGPVRVSEIPALSPVLGHGILTLRNVAGLDARPHLPAGAIEGLPLPDGAESVSPWLLRRFLGLPPLKPMLPRVLVRSAAGFLARADARSALNLAREAAALAPRDPDARRLAADAAERLDRRAAPD